ncbi:MAG: putative selenium-dependent hydroxylase accessory protein YqeC [Lachnospiraceae bacterium]|nr:putative selenium-dependent hydroxylase accessory protein YqeC [Lachnospiraceae bacterium]
MKISSLLEIGRGVTALIGGGGKTTLIYTLAEELTAKGSVIICTSTHIRVPGQYMLVTGGGRELRDALKKERCVCAGTPAENGKLTAPSVSFKELEAVADYVLVEADGAKGLPLKAHAPHEPVIPENSGQVILVVGADGLGKMIKEACHRPEIWAKLAGTSPECPATPEGEARVILSEGYGDRVFINKAESARECELAEELAELIHRPAVIGSLKRGSFASFNIGALDSEEGM